MTISASNSYSCAVIGEWHLAFTTASCLAKLGHRVLLVNPMLGAEPSPWRDFPEVPLREPGMPELIAEMRKAGRLDYVNGIGPEWSADYVWLAIDTPVNERDEANVEPLIEVARRVAEARNCRGAFITSSQIPMGFCAELEKRFGLELVYVPENLRLGKGIETFLKADRTVIGARRPETRQQIKQFLSGVETEFFLCDLVTAEMIKHATNAFLATSISFANELARIGEQMGVDNAAVAQALKLDKRIGKGAYLAPGLGFAGGTLPRDLRILQKIGKEKGVPTMLVDSVLSINENTADALVDAIRLYFPEQKGRTALVVGYTYKAETDTLRRSSSIELAQKLRKAGMDVWGYDPMMNNKDLTSLQGTIQHFAQWSDIPRLPDVAIIMTPRPEFSHLAWKELGRDRDRHEARPSLVLDTRVIASEKEVVAAGLSYKALWQPVTDVGKAQDRA